MWFGGLKQVIHSRRSATVRNGYPFRESFYYNNPVLGVPIFGVMGSVSPIISRTTTSGTNHGPASYSGGGCLVTDNDLNIDNRGGCLEAVLATHETSGKLTRQANPDIHYGNCNLLFRCRIIQDVLSVQELESLRLGYT